MPVKDGIRSPSDLPMSLFQSVSLYSLNTLFNISCVLSLLSGAVKKWSLLSFEGNIELLSKNNSKKYSWQHTFTCMQGKPIVDWFHLAKHKQDFYKRRRKEERMKDCRHLENNSFPLISRQLGKKPGKVLCPWTSGWSSKRAVSLVHSLEDLWCFTVTHPWQAVLGHALCYHLHLRSSRTAPLPWSESLIPGTSCGVMS